MEDDILDLESVIVEDVGKGKFHGVLHVLGRHELRLDIHAGVEDLDLVRSSRGNDDRLPLSLDKAPWTNVMLSLQLFKVFLLQVHGSDPERVTRLLLGIFDVLADELLDLFGVFRVEHVPE